MIRLFYLTILCLVCSLNCISNAKSEDLNPSARGSVFRQPGVTSSEIARQAERNVPQRTQVRGVNTQFVSNQTEQRTMPSRAINNRAPAAIEDKTPSKRITPLARQKQGSQGQASNGAARQAPSVWGTLGALLVVISIILVAAKLFKKHSPLVSSNLPLEVMEVLGKRPLDARQTIHFVRCGSRILILGSSPAGLEMLSEVLDPVEVDLISGMCRERAQSGRSNSSFMNLFQSTLKKTDQSVRNQTAADFRQPANTGTEQSPEASEQEEFSDYESAVNRLQQKLLHSSRQSLNENAESEHA